MGYVTFNGSSKFNPQPKPERVDKKDKPKKAKINQVSDKRKAANKIYSEERKKFLAGKMCAVFPKEKATDVHHMKGRVGKLFLDKRYWLPVSRAGHRKIEENPNWAKEMGYSLNRL